MVGHPLHVPDPISAEAASPYFSPWCSHVEVEVNGYKVTRVVAASAREGWVEVYLTDEAGKIDIDDDGEPIKYRRTGTVCLSWGTPA